MAGYEVCMKSSPATLVSQQELILSNSFNVLESPLSSVCIFPKTTLTNGDYLRDNNTNTYGHVKFTGEPFAEFVTLSCVGMTQLKVRHVKSYSQDGLLSHYLFHNS